MVVGLPGVCGRGGGDCADGAATIYPGAPELCDSYDNQCPGDPGYGEIDEGFGTSSCGYGGCARAVQSCLNGSPQTCIPGTPSLEICDDVDNDCDSFTEADEGCDDDGDDYCDTNMVTIGMPAVCPQGGEDCDDGDAVAHPGDSDGDGLSNCWERVGIDGDLDGDVDLDLSSAPYFADPFRKDVFVEVDYMSCFDPTTGLPWGDPWCWLTGWGAQHWDRPSDSALQSVTVVFRQRAGVTLHILYDEALPHESNLEAGVGDLLNIQRGNHPLPEDANGFCDATAMEPDYARFGSRADRQSPNCRGVIAARSWVVRYALFAHNSFPEADPSRRFRGLAPRTCGAQTATCPVIGTAQDGLCSKSALFVALNEATRGVLAAADLWSTDQDGEWADYQAGTFMHELGHTLGLGHGGGDSTHCKPNYLSVMNYAREQHGGGRARWLQGIDDGTPVRIQDWLDYSQAALDPLQESSGLDEQIGIGGVSGLRTIYGPGVCSNAGLQNLVGASGDNQAIDWNDSEELEPTAVTADVNRICGITACEPGEVELTELTGFNDWSRVANCIALPRPASILTGPQYAMFDAIDFPEESTVEDYVNGVLGGRDADGDGVANTVDKCPTVFDAGQVDSDGDQYGDACDCLPADPDNWGIPAEVDGVVFSDANTLTWTQPHYLGANVVRYDTLRSNSSSEFVSSVYCVERNDGMDLESMDPSLPPLGAAFFYQVRAQSGCTNGHGPLGRDSGGAVRLGALCD